MAEAIIGPLVVKLQELAVSEARALVAVNDDIRSLRDKLMWMQAFLRDADPRRRVVPDEASRVWLHQTRDAAFDAEDAVDQYFLLVDLSRYICTHIYIYNTCVLHRACLIRVGGHHVLGLFSTIFRCCVLRKIRPVV
jgi:hypothetical protein